MGWLGVYGTGEISCLSCFADLESLRNVQGASKQKVPAPVGSSQDLKPPEPHTREASGRTCGFLLQAVEIAQVKGTLRPALSHWTASGLSKPRSWVLFAADPIYAFVFILRLCNDVFVSAEGKEGKKAACMFWNPNHIPFLCLSYFKLPCSSQKQCWKPCSRGLRSTSQQQHRLKRVGMTGKAGCTRG